MNFTMNKNRFTLFQAMSIFFAISLLVTSFILITENTTFYNNFLGNLAFFILNLIVIIILFYVAKKSFKYGRKAFISWTLIALSQLVTIACKTQQVMVSIVIRLLAIIWCGNASGQVAFPRGWDQDLISQGCILL